MRRLTNNHSLRCVVVLLLLTTLLTFSVGRVKRVEAVATTATIAAGALLATGVAYISYLALTNGSVTVPASENIHKWLTDIGSKVTQFTSGKSIYSRFYADLLNPSVAVHDLICTLTRSDLMDLYNDFSSTELIRSIVSYTQPLDSGLPTTNFDYDSILTFVSIPEIFYYGNNTYTFADIYADGGTITPFTGARFIKKTNDSTYDSTIVYSDITAPVRNRKNLSGTYSAEMYVDGAWVGINTCQMGAMSYAPNIGGTKYLYPSSFLDYYTYANSANTTILRNSFAYPPLVDADIYDEETGEIIETIPSDLVEVVDTPNWLNNYDPDDDPRPIVPYVPLPYDVSVPNGQWGFNIGELLDTIEEYARDIISLSAISELINAFRDSISGDTNYIYYDNSVSGDTYYQYYQIESVTDYGDYSVTNYNINVSDADEHLPVDLNQIKEYTDNKYLDTIKESATGFGSLISSWVVFWHNSDATLLYTMLGTAILILIAAFIGKWGHS